MQRSVAQGLLPGYRRLNDSTVFSFFACSLSPSPHPLPPPAEGIINRSSKREISRRKRTRDPLFSRTHADSSSFNEPIDRLDRLEFSTVIRSLPFFLSLSLFPSREKGIFDSLKARRGDSRSMEIFYFTFKLNEFLSRRSREK